MKHRILETETQSYYSSISDKEKNSKLLAYLCQYITDKTIDGELDEVSAKIINAIAKLLDISVQFSVGDSNSAVKEALLDLLEKE